MPTFIKSNLNYRVGSYGYMYSRIQEVKQEKDVDILFLGSSHAYRGFDTRIYTKLGYKVFNLGSSAQTPLETKVLLKRYLNSLNPKLIIYDVYPATFASDGVESSTDIIANDKNDINTIEMAIKINNIKTYYTLIYGFFDDFFNINKNHFEAARKGKDLYVSGGFVQMDLEYFKKKEYSMTEYTWCAKQFKAFEDILDMIKEREVVFVQIPSTAALYKSFSNNNSFDSIMHKYGTYYNFNEILSLDDSLHFFDALHLNQRGVLLFNEELIEKLHLKDKTRTHNKYN